jgi:hypothetical protein
MYRRLETEFSHGAEFQQVQNPETEPVERQLFAGAVGSFFWPGSENASSYKMLQKL